jgi:hypothetical protein
LNLSEVVTREVQETKTLLTVGHLCDRLLEAISTRH